MNEFDDFLEIDGDLEELFLELSMRNVKIFLDKINARHIEDVAVKFKKQPFLDIVVAFLINGQVVYFDQEYIKLKILKERYDSVVANMFKTYDYQKIDEICKILQQNILKKYKKSAAK